LSPEQLDYVLQLHPRPPVIAFDGDRPGQESNVRQAMAAAAKGMEVVATTLPDRADPASWLADHGPAGLAAWTRKGCLNPTQDGVKPALAGGIVVQHLWDTARAAAEQQGIEFDRTVV
jgi:hypothetical protein